MDPLLLHLVRETLWVVLLVSAPPVGAALAVGLATGVLQAATQIQDPAGGVVRRPAAPARGGVPRPRREGRPVTAAFLAALRLAPVALVSPFLGGPLVPPAVRLALAVALGLAGAGAAPAAPAPEGVALAAAAFRELALGTVLAVVAAAPVEAARAAGRLADTFRGATLAELHVAPLRQRESASGDLLAQAVVVLAAWAGADRLLVRGLLGSFAALPPGLPFAPGAAVEVALRGAAGVLSCAVSLAAPAAAGVLAADLVLA